MAAPTQKTADPAFSMWSGWNHTWTLLSHRISLLRVRSLDDGEAESGILGGDWSTGESWSDTVDYRIHQQTISSPDLAAYHGQSVFQVRTDTPVAETVALDDIDADLVVLRGFEINTDVAQEDAYPANYDPALGYTSRGFALSVSLNADGDVAVEGTVRWGPRDRDNMNAAIPEATSQLTVWWTAISGVEAHEELFFSASKDLTHTPPNSDQSGVREPTGWSGTGAAGLAKIDLRLFDTDGGDGGDYVRSFGVEIPPGDRGVAPSDIAGEILTTSLIELGVMSMDLDVHALWIPLEADVHAVTSQTFRGTHDIGTFVVNQSTILAQE